MKKSIYLLGAVALLFIGACKKSGNNPVNSLVGKWKFFEQYVSPGGLGVWMAATSDKYVQFYADGKLQSDFYSNYSTYAIKDTLTVVMNNDQKTNTQNYTYLINKDTLVLSPAGPVFCIEGCATKFVREK